MNTLKFHRKKAASKRQAKEQLIGCFQKAREAFHQNPSVSHRLVKKARRLAMKHKFKIPAPYNRQYCRNCISFLMPGSNVSIRTRKGHVVYFCRECRHIRRYPYKPRR
ncbi:MAG TPA: ribonuclease P [Candidatus Nanoarchaeia archaeon]|nr:ribonuclease P [Candidatus Nanoarchaeia archaeon]